MRGKPHTCCVLSNESEFQLLSQLRLNSSQNSFFVVALWRAEVGISLLACVRTCVPSTPGLWNPEKKFPFSKI